MFEFIIGFLGMEWAGILLILLSIMVILLITAIIIIWKKIPMWVKPFMQKFKADEVLLYVKPLNVFIKGKYIDGNITFKIRDHKYTFIMDEKELETFYGIRHCIIYLDELIGLKNEDYVEISKFTEQYPKEVLISYLFTSQKIYELEKILSKNGISIPSYEEFHNNIDEYSDDAKRLLLNYFNRLHTKQEIEEAYPYILEKTLLPDTNKEIYTIRTVNWKRISDIVKYGSLSKYTNLAEAYGLATSKLQEKAPMWIWYAIGFGGLSLLAAIIFMNTGNHDTVTYVVSNATQIPK